VGEAIFSTVLYRPHVERMTDTKRSDYIEIYARSAMITVAACGPAFVLMLVYGWSAATPVPLVGLSIALGIGLWLIALYMTGHPLGEEIDHFLAKGRQVLRRARRAPGDVN
jgi:fatty acid desaturase